MATENALKVLQTTRAPRRKALDMPHIYSYVPQQQVVNQFMKIMAPNSPMNLFSDLNGLISADSTEEGMSHLMTVERNGIQTEFHVTRTFVEKLVPGRVTDNSRVPAKLVAPNPGAPQAAAQYAFTFRVNRDMGEAGSAFLLRDKKTMIFAIDKKNAGTEECEYTCQLVGIPGETADGSLLAMDSPIRYQMGNSMGEGSLAGLPMVGNGEVSFDQVNVTQVVRSTIIRTGNAMADNTLTAILQDAQGNRLDVSTDMPAQGFKQATQELTNLVMFNRPNFTAKDRRIANTMANSRYPERPFFAGVYYQWNLAPYRWEHFLRSSDAAMVAKLEFILESTRARTGKKARLMAICQGIGRKWLKKAFFAMAEKYKYQIHTTATGGKLGDGSVGYDIEKIYTPDGEIYLYDISQPQDAWSMSDRIGYGGVSYEAMTNRIYFTPISTTDSRSGITKPVVRIYHKEKDDIRRLLNMAVMNGHVGRNGMTPEQLLSLSDDQLKKMVSNDRSRVDSMVDGDEVCWLSQITVKCDYDKMSILDLK